MSIVDYLKSVFSNEMRKEVANFKSRKQFNVEIEPEIADAVRNLAKMFKVPHYSAAEHLYQVGIYFTLQAIRDDEKSKLIGQHLSDRHLLDLPVQDEESIILLSQDNSNWLLLKQANLVLRCYERFRNALKIVKRTGNMEYVEKCKRELDVAVIRFAERICRHRLDYSGESSGESEKEDQENGNNIQETGRI